MLPVGAAVGPAKQGARLFIEGDGGEGELVGLEHPEQLGEVPHDYRGLLLIEDMYAVGRALER